MNKALASTLAAAFGLSVAACAGETDENTTEDNDVKVVMDKDGRLQDDKSASGDETQGTDVQRACMLKSAQGIKIQCACW